MKSFLLSFLILSALAATTSNSSMASFLVCKSLLTGKNVSLKEIAKEYIPANPRSKSFKKKLINTREIKNVDEAAIAYDAYAPLLLEVRKGETVEYVVHFDGSIVTSSGRRVDAEKYLTARSGRVVVRAFELPFIIAPEYFERLVIEEEYVAHRSGAFLEPGVEQIIEGSSGRNKERDEKLSEERDSFNFQYWDGGSGHGRGVE